MMVSIPKRLAAATASWLLDPQSTVMIRAGLPGTCQLHDMDRREAVTFMDAMGKMCADASTGRLEKIDHQGRAGHAIGIIVSDHQNIFFFGKRPANAFNGGLHISQ